MLFLHFTEDAWRWKESLDYFQLIRLPEEELEKLFLDRWSHVGKQDKAITNGLFSCDKSILHVHGCIHKENFMVSINPSFQQNFINVQLVKRLEIPTKNIQST